MTVINIHTRKKSELIDITEEVKKIVAAEKTKDGTIFLFVPHTTAGLTINENSDPSVKSDIIGKMNEMIPEDDGYSHSEGNSASHIKSSLFGNELFFFIENGQLVLGTWQGIYFCEFDGPRDRELYLKIL